MRLPTPDPGVPPAGPLIAIVGVCAAGKSTLAAGLRAAVETASGDEGWANLGTVGQLMRKQHPDFDSRNWGYAKLSDLVRAIDLFAVEAEPGGVRLRNRKRPR